MAEWFFPSRSVNHDRTYSDKDFAGFYKNIFRDGVCAAIGQALKVKVSPSGGMRIIVSSGAAILQGYQYQLTDEVALQIPVASTTSSRTDSIVIRHDKSARKIYAAVKANSTAVERSDMVHEIQLATIKIPRNASSVLAEYITDKRADGEVCGYATPFERLSVSGLENQYKAMLDRIADESKLKSDGITDRAYSDFNNWFLGVKNLMGVDAAGKLTNQLKEITPDNLLVTVNHEQDGYPVLDHVIYWSYGIGTVELGKQPPGVPFDGTAPEDILFKAVYPSRQFIEIRTPLNVALTYPKIEQIDSKTYKVTEGVHAFIFYFKTDINFKTSI